MLAASRFSSSMSPSFAQAASRAAAVSLPPEHCTTLAAGTDALMRSMEALSILLRRTLDASICLSVIAFTLPRVRSERLTETVD